MTENSQMLQRRGFFKSYLFVIMCVCGGGAVHVQVVPTQSRRGCPIPGVGLAGRWELPDTNAQK